MSAANDPRLLTAVIPDAGEAARVALVGITQDIRGCEIPAAPSGPVGPTGSGRS
jgi:hypothetical protein